MPTGACRSVNKPLNFPQVFLALLLTGIVLVAAYFLIVPKQPVYMPPGACLSNLKQISMGMLQYRSDWDERYPNSAGWIDATLPYVRNETLYRCSALPQGEYGYAMMDAESERKAPQDSKTASHTLLG